MTEEERETYTRIIDGILAEADLQTVTRKKIRQGLEAQIDRDLSDKKVGATHHTSATALPVLTGWSTKQDAIKSLIEARFDAISAEVAQGMPTPTSGAAAEPSPAREANGGSPSDDADDTGADGEIQVSLPPAKKKQKRESSSEDADARLAAELQAQENRLSRGRVTRGGGAAKPKAKSKASKKKSAKRVRSDDDSNADDSEVEDKPKRKAGGGFQKPFNLSDPLAELCGESQVRVFPTAAGAAESAFSPADGNASAVAPPSGQEAMGLHQGQRASGPQRQAADTVRRQVASRVQARKDQHVLHEQAPRESALSDRRVVGTWNWVVGWASLYPPSDFRRPGMCACPHGMPGRFTGFGHDAVVPLFLGWLAGAVGVWLLFCFFFFLFVLD